MTRLPTSKLTYIALTFVLGGFALIAFAWWKTAVRDDVALQVPYLISAGLSGVALIVLGAVALNIDARRREAAVRHRQLERLTAVVLEVAQHLAPGARFDDAPADTTDQLTPSAARWERSDA